MQTRYIIEEVELSPETNVVPHPLWPGLIVWKLFDRIKREYSLGCWLRQETAQAICERKNSS
jgi:hypothetical protein